MLLSLSSRYEDGADWADTELYERYRERIQKGDPYWRCTTLEELESYFESIDYTRKYRKADTSHSENSSWRTPCRSGDGTRTPHTRYYRRSG